MDAVIFGNPREVHINQRARPEPRPNAAMVAMQAACICTSPYVTCGPAEITGIVERLWADTAMPTIGLPVVVELIIIDRLNPAPSDMKRCAEPISGGLQA